MDYFSMMFHGPGCMCGMENISWLDISPETNSESEDKTDSVEQLSAAPAEQQ